jgi:hypothetical protein
VYFGRKENKQMVRYTLGYLRYAFTALSVVAFGVNLSN